MKFLCVFTMQNNKHSVLTKAESDAIVNHESFEPEPINGYVMGDTSPLAAYLISTGDSEDYSYSGVNHLGDNDPRHRAARPGHRDDALDGLRRHGLAGGERRRLHHGGVLDDAGGRRAAGGR